MTAQQNLSEKKKMKKKIRAVKMPQQQMGVLATKPDTVPPTHRVEEENRWSTDLQMYVLLSKYIIHK